MNKSTLTFALKSKLSIFVSMGYDVFISYRRETDKVVARSLKEALAKRGYRVFLDVDDLKDGQYGPVLVEAVNTTPVFIAILTPGYLSGFAKEDDHARQELSMAIERGASIIPVLPDAKDISYPDFVPSAIRTELMSRQYSFLDTEQLFVLSVDKIVKDRIRNRVGIGKRRKALLWSAGALGGVIIAACALLLGPNLSERDNFEKADRMLSHAERIENRKGPKAARDLFMKAAEKGLSFGNIEYDEYNAGGDRDDLEDAARLYHNAGYGFQKAEAFSESVKAYSMAVSSFSTLAEKFDKDFVYEQTYSLNNLAYSYAGLGDWDNAMRCIEDALKIAPDIVNSYDSKGELLYMQGRYDEALEAWKTLREKDPYFTQEYWVDSLEAHSYAPEKE